MAPDRPDFTFPISVSQIPIHLFTCIFVKPDASTEAMKGATGSIAFGILLPSLELRHDFVANSRRN